MHVLLPELSDACRCLPMGHTMAQQRLSTLLPPGRDISIAQPDKSLRSSHLLKLPPAGTLTQNDMKVVRLWTAGTDHKNIAQLPVLGVPKFRNSTEVTGNPGTGSSLDVGSMIKPDAPLALHPDVLSLLVTGIAVNSNAHLRLDSSPSGGHSAQCWQCRCVLFTEVLLLHK